MPETTVKRRIVNIAAFIAECLKEKGLEVEQIVVFGSHADGSNRKDSDIDIIIVSSQFEGKNIFERVEMISGVHAKTVSKFRVPLDILLKSPEEAKDSDFYRNGIVVWAA